MGLRSFVKWLLGYKKKKKEETDEDENVSVTDIKLKSNGEIDANVDMKDAVTEVIEQLKLEGIISCSSIDETPSNTPTRCRNNNETNDTCKTNKMVLRPKKRIKKKNVTKV
jgi:hypothetical protein